MLKKIKRQKLRKILIKPQSNFYYYVQKIEAQAKKTPYISFIKMLKSRGIEPCGTPDAIALHIIKQFPTLHLFS